MPAYFQFSEFFYKEKRGLAARLRLRGSRTTCAGGAQVEELAVASLAT